MMVVLLMTTACLSIVHVGEAAHTTPPLSKTRKKGFFWKHGFILKNSIDHDNRNSPACERWLQEQGVLEDNNKEGQSHPLSTL
jgi:hypothetical protein